MKNQSRRRFLGSLGATAAAIPAMRQGTNALAQAPVAGMEQTNGIMASGHEYNGAYTGRNLDRIAFPIGGIGAGMYCLEGTGAISHMSVRNVADLANEPVMFAALCVKGDQPVARVLEGPAQEWKKFGRRLTGNGGSGTTYGLPRFDGAVFRAQFPFAEIALSDERVPLEVAITGWSPFIPGDADNSSLPAGALEYRFVNPTNRTIEAVFSYNSTNFMASPAQTDNWGSEGRGNHIDGIENGFVLRQDGNDENPEREGSFAIFVDDDNAVIDHSWFRGGWWDPLTVTWKHIERGTVIDNPRLPGASPGATLYVPFTLAPGQEKTVRLMTVWYVPCSNTRLGNDPEGTPDPSESGIKCRCTCGNHQPWYAGRFTDINDLAGYFRTHYDNLREKTALFTESFYDTTLPGEVVEAIAANLTILKSTTTMRQMDGRLWCFEGSGDDWGCCHGSCTHVWNYAQAIPHLFPELERTLRETEFLVSQDETGHQMFRSALPIRPLVHDFHAASDGQLGGIMKMYREWRISGDTAWLQSMWPKVKQSLDYCIVTWDPTHKGTLEEPHHNTYDIEFWGPDGMCTSFYLGALTAAVRMGETLNEDVTLYRSLREKGVAFLETNLYNGEYFYQRTQWTGLQAEFEPVDYTANGAGYENEILLLNNEGPKYQYGEGCISDGVLGFWLARMCGLDEIVDPAKVKSHLRAVYTYNLKRDLSEHANSQRPTFALGYEGGLLLCSWPRGGKPTLPFVYSDEVWTGIEYQVASHLMLEGMVEQGLDIVRVARDRYDGTVRNPFDEYECGHWYARALSSYGLIQGLTGVRYDAIDKTLYFDSRIGNNFRVFLSTGTGFGTVGLDNGKPFVNMRSGALDVRRVMIGDSETKL